MARAKARFHWVTVTVSEQAAGALGRTVRTVRLKMPGPKPTPAEQKRMRDAWCSCAEPGDPIYYQHGHAHGYDCSKCGKLLQTG